MARANSFMAAWRGLFVGRPDFNLGNDAITDRGIANAVWITGRNAANTADVNMARVNASDEVEITCGVSKMVTALVSVTNTQLKALRATPKDLVAAPGAGKVLELVGGVLLLDYGTNALTESTANLAVKYTDGSGVQVSQTIEMTGFIDQTADTMTSILPKIDAIVAKSGCENKALVLHNLGGAEFGGNAANDTVLRVMITYRVHTTSW